jgi:5'-deoxynucleotidase YfbR-like HD superfamily hydrolase
MKNFDTLYEAGRIKRFHTVATHQTQTVAAHTWGVMMIVLKICPEPSLELIRAVTFHDIAECTTGDIPATAKWDYPSLKREAESIEQTFNVAHGIYASLTPLEERILKWADMAELVLFCEQEIRLGNQNMQRIWTNGIQYLKRLGYPTPEAEAFSHDCLYLS